MRRWLTLALLFASTCGWAAAGEGAYFDISDFHCGVDSYHSSLAINDCYVQDALNVYFDKDAPAVKRSGYTTFVSSNGYAYTGLWSYTDGANNVWMVARSSDAIIATTGVGTSLFNVKIATVSSNNIVNSVNAFGNIYFVDQTQGVYYWNGSSTTFVSGSPRGSLIAQFHNRVWVSGLASPLGNYLYGSKYLDGATWTTGINANDPVLLQVALNDNFDVITALWAGYNDIMYVFKNYSVHGLYGFDQTDFQMRVLNGEVGCIDQRSIQFFLGGLVFASARGIESFDGYTATRISDPLKNKVDPITLNSSFNQNSWSQDSQTDFAAGTISPTGYLSTDVSAGSVVLSTQVAFSTTNTTAGDWNAGTLVNLDSTTVSGSLVLQVSSPTNQSQFTQAGSEATWVLFPPSCGSQLTAAQSFTTSANNQKLTSVELYIGKVGSPNNVTLRIKSDSAGTPGSDLATVTITASALTGSFAWTTYTLSSPLTLSPSTKYWVQVDGDSGGSSSNYIFYGRSTTDLYAGGEGYRVSCGGCCTTGAQTFDWSFRANVSGVYASTGSYTSPTFDIGFDTNTFLWNWGTFTADSTLNSQTITYLTKVSSSPTGVFDPVSTVTSGSTIGSQTRRYAVYIASFSTSDTAATPQLNSITFGTSAMQKSSGTYTSQSHNISTATAFGNLSIGDSKTGSGNIVYNVCSSNNSSMTGKSCVVTAANSSISVSTNIYVQVIASFTVANATDTAILQNFNIAWYTGSRKPPMASMVYDNRYWLSVTTNTADSFNDATLVLSAGPLWTVFDIQAGAFTIWKNAPYFGNSASTGYVYQLEQGQNDNGAAINAYIRTKDYSPGGLTMDKFFGKIHLVADNLGAYNIYTNYFIDRSTTSFSLGNAVQNETPGTMITKVQFPIDSTHMNYGKTISFKFQQNDVSAPWKFYGATLRYKPRRPQ